MILGFYTCNLFAAQITSTWVGGSWGEWEDASNWSPAIVPENGTTTFAVTIDGAMDRASVQLFTDHKIDSLHTYNTVKLKGYRLVEQSDITLVNSLVNYGLLKMNGPEIIGEVINRAGAEIHVSSHQEFNVFGPDGVQNHGTVSLPPAVRIWSESDIDNVGTIEMYGGMCVAQGNIVNDAAGIIRGSGYVGFEPILVDNKGLIQSSGGTLFLLASSISNTGTLKNTPGASIRTRLGPSNQSNEGLIQVYSEGAVVFDCNLVNEPNGVIKLLGGTFAATNITQKAGATFEGFGGITGNVTIEPNSVSEPQSIVKLTGPTNIIGDVTVSAGAILRISDGQTLITGQTVNNGTIELSGSTVVFQGGYSGSGNLEERETVSIGFGLNLHKIATRLQQAKKDNPSQRKNNQSILFQ